MKYVLGATGFGVLFIASLLLRAGLQEKIERYVGSDMALFLGVGLMVFALWRYHTING